MSVRHLQAEYVEKLHGNGAKNEEGLENGKKVKKYTYSYEEYEEQGKGPDSRVEDILADPDFPGLTGIIIGDWGDAWGRWLSDNAG